jgi:hypothetical protein
MHKSQVNRAAVAARVTAAPRINATMPLDSLTRVMPYGFTGTRRHGNKARMTDAQRDSTGRFSDWNRSPYTPRAGWR